MRCLNKFDFIVNFSAASTCLRMRMEGDEDVGLSSETGSDNFVSTPVAAPVAALPSQDVVPKDGSDADAASSDTDTRLESPVERSGETEEYRDVDTAVSEGVTRQASEQVIDQLSGGLLANVLPDLNAAKMTLSEITWVHSANVE